MAAWDAGLFNAGLVSSLCPAMEAAGLLAILFPMAGFFFTSLDVGRSAPLSYSLLCALDASGTSHYFTTCDLHGHFFARLALHTFVFSSDKLS